MPADSEYALKIKILAEAKSAINTIENVSDAEKKLLENTDKLSIYQKQAEKTTQDLNQSLRQGVGDVVDYNHQLDNSSLKLVDFGAANHDAGFNVNLLRANSGLLKLGLKGLAAVAVAAGSAIYDMVSNSMAAANELASFERGEKQLEDLSQAAQDMNTQLSSLDVARIIALNSAWDDSIDALDGVNNVLSVANQATLGMAPAIFLVQEKFSELTAGVFDFGFEADTAARLVVAGMAMGYQAQTALQVSTKGLEIAYLYLKRGGVDAFVAMGDAGAALADVTIGGIVRAIGVAYSKLGSFANSAAGAFENIPGFAGAAANLRSYSVSLAATGLGMRNYSINANDLKIKQRAVNKELAAAKKELSKLLSGPSGFQKAQAAYDAANQRLTTRAKLLQRERLAEKAANASRAKGTKSIKNRSAARNKQLKVETSALNKLNKAREKAAKIAKAAADKVNKAELDSRLALIDGFNKQVAALDRTIFTYGKSGDAVALYDARLKRFGENQLRYSETQISTIVGKTRQIELLEKQKEKQQALDKQREEGIKVLNAAREGYEHYAKGLGDAEDNVKGLNVAEQQQLSVWRKKLQALKTFRELDNVNKDLTLSVGVANGGLSEAQQSMANKEAEINKKVAAFTREYGSATADLYRKKLKLRAVTELQIEKEEKQAEAYRAARDWLKKYNIENTRRAKGIKAESIEAFRLKQVYLDLDPVLQKLADNAFYTRRDIAGKTELTRLKRSRALFEIERSRGKQARLLNELTEKYGAHNALLIAQEKQKLALSKYQEESKKRLLNLAFEAALKGNNATVADGRALVGGAIDIAKASPDPRVKAAAEAAGMSLQVIRALLSNSVSQAEIDAARGDDAQKLAEGGNRFLKLIAKNSNETAFPMLEYTRQMSGYLASIDRNKLLKSDFSFSDYKTKNTSTVGLGGLSGAERTEEVIGRGLKVSNQTIGDILKSGRVEAQEFISILKKGSDFWSSWESVATDFAALPDDVKERLGQSVIDTITIASQAVNVLGFDAKNFIDLVSKGSLDLGTDKENKLNGGADDLQKALIAGTESAVAAAVKKIPGLDALVEQFGVAGEGTKDTLVRIAAEFSQTSASMQRAGLSFKNSADQYGTSIQRQSLLLVQAAGGLDKLNKSLATYYNRFFSEEEKLKKSSEETRKAFADMGLQFPKTRAEYKALIEKYSKIDTDEARKKLARLLALSGASADLYDAEDARLKKEQELIKSQKDLLAANELFYAQNFGGVNGKMALMFNDLQVGFDGLGSASLGGLAGIDLTSSKEYSDLVNGSSGAMREELLALAPSMLAITQQATALQDAINNANVAVVSAAHNVTVAERNLSKAYTQAEKQRAEITLKYAQQKVQMYNNIIAAQSYGVALGDTVTAQNLAVSSLAVFAGGFSNFISLLKNSREKLYSDDEQRLLAQLKAAQAISETANEFGYDISSIETTSGLRQQIELLNAAGLSSEDAQKRMVALLKLTDHVSFLKKENFTVSQAFINVPDYLHDIGQSADALIPPVASAVDQLHLANQALLAVADTAASEFARIDEALQSSINAVNAAREQHAAALNALAVAESNWAAFMRFIEETTRSLIAGAESARAAEERAAQAERERLARERARRNEEQRDDPSRNSETDPLNGQTRGPSYSAARVATPHFKNAKNDDLLSRYLAKVDAQQNRLAVGIEQLAVHTSKTAYYVESLNDYKEAENDQL